MQKKVADGSVTIVLEKDLTADNVTDFERQLSDYLAEEDDMMELVLDLSHTQNIDSVGVTFIIGWYKRMQEDGLLFRVAGASDDVKSLFKLMKLDQFFDLEG